MWYDLSVAQTKVTPFFLFSPWFLQTLVWIPTRFCLWFFCRLRVTGLENLRAVRSKGVIFAANHASELDPILLPASLPMFSRFMPIFYASRERSFYKTSGWRQIFYGGTFFRLWGAHQVLVGQQNYAKSLATHLELLQGGKSIFIFPEGGKTKDGKIGIAKGGVGYLAHKTQKPVIPIFLSGHFRITLKDFLLRRRTITVHFGKPFYFSLFHHQNDTIYPQTYREYAKTLMMKVAEMGTEEVSVHSVVQG